MTRFVVYTTAKGVRRYYGSFADREEAEQRGLEVVEDLFENGTGRVPMVIVEPVER